MPRRKLFWIFIPFLTIAGCERSTATTETAPVAAASAAVVAAPPPPSITKMDWSRAVETTYLVKSKKSDGQGVTEFVGCFGGDEKRCDPLTFGERDEFRSLTTFTPSNSRLARFGMPRYLHTYVSLIDCEQPSILFNANFFSKNGWIFLNKVGILADGKLILSKDLQRASVDRDSQSYGINESATWIASEQELSALRSISSASALAIRFTGEKGYVNVSNDDIAKFRKDASEVIKVHDVLNAAIDGKLPSSCK